MLAWRVPVPSTSPRSRTVLRLLRSLALALKRGVRVAHQPVSWEATAPRRRGTPRGEDQSQYYLCGPLSHRRRSRSWRTATVVGFSRQIRLSGAEATSLPRVCTHRESMTRQPARVRRQTSIVVFQTIGQTSRYRLLRSHSRSQKPRGLPKPSAGERARRGSCGMMHA